MAAGKQRIGVFIAAGLLVAFGLAFFLGPQASSEPDGLNKVAIDEGFDRTETDHALADSPAAGYAIEGVDDDRLATGLAGLTGVAITFLVGAGLVMVMRRANRSKPSASPTGAGAGS